MSLEIATWKGVPVEDLTALELLYMKKWALACMARIDHDHEEALVPYPRHQELDDANQATVDTANRLLAEIDEAAA